MENTTKNGATNEPADLNNQAAQPQSKIRELLKYIAVSIIILIPVVSIYSNENKKLRAQLESQSNNLSTTQNEITPTVSTLLNPTELMPDNQQTYQYQNFKIDFPTDWTLLEMGRSNNFPLKSVLSTLYQNEKVIAINKNGISMLITIEKASKGEAGGYFTTENEYKEYLENNDKITINNEEFYLYKKHSNINYLEMSETGPWMWGNLSEYVEGEPTASGNVFKGYQRIIKRNNYIYNIIITSDAEGLTDSKTQSEIISILQTIKW